MIIAKFEPEDVTRQIKSTYLATPIVKDFVGAHAAADHAVDVVRRPFSPKISAFGARYARARQLHVLGERAALLGAIGRWRRSRSNAGKGWDIGDVVGETGRESMALYLRDCRGLLVAPGGKTKNSEDVPKGFYGRD